MGYHLSGERVAKALCRRFSSGGGGTLIGFEVRFSGIDIIKGCFF